MYDFSVSFIRLYYKFLEIRDHKRSNKWNNTAHQIVSYTNSLSVLFKILKRNRLHRVVAILCVCMCIHIQT